MPGRDGIDVYRTAVGKAPALGARFVFMTGGVFTTRGRTFLDEARPVLLEKPMTTPQIREAVESVLAAR
jgi:hypothetical protein